MSEHNPSGIRPMEFNVLVAPKEIEAKTKGGIILPDETKEKQEFARMEGILVAKSPMAFSFDEWPPDQEGQKPQIGDRVIFSKYNATSVTGRDGKDYWLMKDRSIAGVMSDE